MVYVFELRLSYRSMYPCKKKEISRKLSHALMDEIK